MDLRQLRHAVVLARSGSYVRAAEELHITQSALTRSIRGLEDELGVRLFDRGRQGAQPTQEGRLLVDRAEHIQLAVRGLRHDLGLSAKGEFGAIGLGMGPLVAAVLLPDLLIRILNTYPRLKVHTEINNPDYLLNALVEERIEFFVCSRGQLAESDKIAVSSLGTLPLAMYVRAEHPLAGKSRIKRTDLANYPVISGSSTAIAQAQAALHADQTGRAPLTFTATCDDFLIVKEVVLKSDAVWLTSSATVVEECRRGILAPLSIPDAGMPNTTALVIVSLAGRNLSAPAQLAIRLMKQLYKEKRSLTG